MNTWNEDYKHPDFKPQDQSDGFPGFAMIVASAAIFLLTFAFCALGAPPDPWVRMTSPSGCSGGVFHASREHGIWIATCKHCVSRPGRVRLVFFKDGQRANVDGRFLRSHPRYDCSIVWVSPDHFHELPAATPIAGGNIGPFVGQAVFSVGSYAGNTITPAARHVAVSSVGRGAYEFRLNDSAWGGHSGGPVVDAATGGLLGVLWGRTKGQSFVTSNRALLETFYGASNAGQAMYSVHDDIGAHEVASKPDVKVRANRSDIRAIRAEVEGSHFLHGHFDFDWDTESSLSTPRVEWKINGKRLRSSGWYGQDGFIWQWRQTGGRFT